MPSKVPPAFVIKSVMRVRQFLLRTADRLLPAEIVLLEHSVGFTRTHLLATIVQFGIPGHLADGPRTAEQLAAATGANADALHRVLRAAGVYGFVRLDAGGRFHETRLTRALRETARFQSADWCRYAASASLQRAWCALPATVCSGENAFRRTHGTSMFDWLDSHPEEGRAFSRGLAGLTLSEAPAILAAYPFPAEGVICDVAGGTGALLGEILRAKPRARGVLVEAPLVLAEARRYLEGAGLDGRVAFVEGDLASSVTAEADLYILKWVLHDWSDATCETMLRVVGATMKPGSRLLVIEGEQDANQVSPRFGPLDVQMLTVCEGGRERSVAELRALIQATGLEPGRVTRTATGLALVEGVAVGAK